MTPERLTTPSGKLLALVARPEAHPDLRGSVRETYRRSWFPEYVGDIKQLVQSDSNAQVLRGMHLHRKQWDIWRFTHGIALVRLMDHETGEQAFFHGDGASVIAIPPGISHGFYAPQGCTLVYALTEEYDGSDEYGWFPLDGLPEDTAHELDYWPRDHEGLVLSLRDLRAPRLAEFEG